MNLKIIKTYDIRGVYPKDINEKDAFLIGRSFASFLSSKTKKKRPAIVVGRDGRISSPSLFKEAKRGIIGGGADVYDIGMVTTPLLNFTVAKKKYNGGLMVTASHNPPQYNGFKLIKEKALQIHGDEIREVGKIAEKGGFGENGGEIKNLNPFPDYEKKLLGEFKEIKELKVVADYGNGVSSVTGKKILASLRIELINLFDRIDGLFPNHHPNPHNRENFAFLQKKVREHKADLGIFFDGDGDRSILVDEKGEIVSPDFLLALLAEDELKRGKGKVYYDLRFSKIVGEKIKKDGGDPVMMRVGNPFYKEKIIKGDGILGGELSGHVMFKNHFGIDDGLYTALRAMAILSEKKSPLSEMINPLKVYHQSEEINIEVKNKKAAIERVKSAFADGKSRDIDGVYISYPDWWFNLRESNTEDLIRLKIEAKRKDVLDRKRKEIIRTVKS